MSSYLTTPARPDPLPGNLDEFPSINSDVEKPATLRDDGKSHTTSRDTAEMGEAIGMDESLNARAITSPSTLANDDPLNPRLWSGWKRAIVGFVLCIWVLALTYASTAYVASIAAIEREFGISQEVSILGVSLVVLGFAAGPLIFGPSSELFGRRNVYILCGVCFSAFSFGAAFAQNAATLLICRFLLGFFGSASLNTVPASLADITYPHNRAPYNALYSVGAFLGPALGPLCSSFIEADAGMRWNLRVMAIFSTVTSIAVAFVPETHGPTLWKRHRRPPTQVAKVDMKTKLRGIMGVYKGALKRPIVFFFTEPIVLFISIYLSILYGILYGFFEAFEIVYVQRRGFSTTSYGLTYIALALGFCVAAALIASVGGIAYRKEAAKAKETGESAPAEARLVLGYASAIVSPISLFLFAWTAPYPRIHWVVPCIAEFLFSLSMQLIFVSFISYMIDVYTMHAASALAAALAARSLLGGVFPLFAIQMYKALTIQGATSLLAGLALLCAPLPFIFRKIGKPLRLKSKYAVVV